MAPFLNVRLNYTDTKNTHHYLCRCVSYQGIYEQTSGSAEDTVKDTWIGHLLLLLLVYDSLHKQLQDSWVFLSFRPVGRRPSPSLALNNE